MLDDDEFEGFDNERPSKTKQPEKPQELKINKVSRWMSNRLSLFSHTCVNAQKKYCLKKQVVWNDL